LGINDAENFNWPYYMGMDGKGRLCVADSHNCAIKLYDPRTFKYIGKIGGEKFACILGFAYDSIESGFFHAYDYDKSQLMSFSSDGNFSNYIDIDLPVKASDVNIDRQGNIVLSVFDGYMKYKR